MALTKKDVIILKALQDDAKQSSRDLSKKLGLPATTIYERIKKMEANGVIKGYHVAIDYTKAGLPSTALVLVRRASKMLSGKKLSHNKLADALAKLPEVQEVHAVSGEFDLVIKLRGKDERAIGSFVIDTIWNLPEVERTTSLVSFYSSKDTCKVELK